MMSVGCYFCLRPVKAGATHERECPAEKGDPWKVERAREEALAKNGDLEASAAYIDAVREANKPAPEFTCWVQFPDEWPYPDCRDYEYAHPGMCTGQQLNGPDSPCVKCGAKPYTKAHYDGPGIAEDLRSAMAPYLHANNSSEAKVIVRPWNEDDLETTRRLYSIMFPVRYPLGFDPI